jgi:hypothetical protein
MVLVVFSGVIAGPHGPTGSHLEHGVESWMPAGHAGSLLSAFSMAIGMVLVIGAWLALGLIVRRDAPLRPLHMCAVAWALPLIVGPPLYSRDVYSYAALGRMVNSHLNPYQVGPAAMGASSRFVAPVGTAWLHTPSPYGPLFISLASVIVRVSRNDLLTSVFLLRAVSIVSMVVIAYVLPKIAVSAGKDPARAIWLGVCNPIILINFIGGAHNDALMMAMILVGLACSYAERPIIAVVVCTLAAGIKSPAAIALVFVIAQDMTMHRDRVQRFVKDVAAAIATFLVVTWVAGLGWGWLHAMSIPGTNHVLLTPSTVLAHYASDFVGHDNAVLAATRLLGELAAFAIIAVLVARAPVIGTARACGIALAVVVVLGPIVLPWYALWSVVVIAAAGRRIERGFAIATSVVLAATVEPSGSVMPDIVLVGAVCALAVLAFLTVLKPVRHWIRTQLALGLDEYRQLDPNRRTGELVRNVMRVRPQSTLEPPLESGLA